MSPTAELETRRLRLELPGPHHAEELYRLMNSPDWLRFIGDRGITNVASAETYIKESLLQHHRQHGLGMYYVFQKPSTFIGMAGFVKRAHLPHPDLGLAFLPDYCGLGFGLEVSEKLLEMAGDTLGLKELWAVTSPANQNARKLVERLGFEFLTEQLNPDGVKLRTYRYRPGSWSTLSPSRR